MKAIALFFIFFSSISLAGSMPRLHDNCTDLVSPFISENNTYSPFVTDKKYSKFIGLNSSDGVNISVKDLGSDKLNQLMLQSKGFLCLTGNERDLRKILSRKIASNKINIMAGIPSNGEGIRATWSHLRDTYSEDKINKYVKQMERARKAWGEQNIVEVSYTRSISQKIKDRINSSEIEQLDVIFAHNENGILRFEDGSVMDSSWIGKFNLKSNLPIILSCETYKHVDQFSGIVTSKRMDFEDTGVVVNNTLAALSKRDNLTVNDFVLELELQFSSLSELKHEKKVRVAIGVTATGGISLSLVVISED